MDIDFHYYATFVAAVVAGYNQDEAAAIAHNAQYVDDSTPDRILHKAGIGFRPVVTTLGLGDEVDRADDWSTGTIARDRAMWTAFHFLPGNLDLKYPYHGAHESRGVFGSFKYDDLAKQEFRTLCTPDSPMAVAMVNDTVASHAGDLAMIGIRMHVLIDTFAHMLYSGSAAWHVNDVAAQPEVRLSNGDFLPVAIPAFTYTPQGFYYNSVAYTGHGRMGHVPDLPWVTYRYKPQWSKTPIVKDNPKEYRRAFQEMVTAMRCIRERRMYDPNQLDTDDRLERVLGVVSQIIGQPPAVKDALVWGLLNDFPEQRCEVWIGKMKALGEAAGLSLSAPPKYSADSWFDVAKKECPEKVGDTSYAHFHRAAATHLQWVKDAVRDAGLTLLGEEKYVTKEELVRVLDKPLRIYPAATKHTCWEVEDSSTHEGTPVQLWDGERASNLWEIQHAEKSDDGTDRFYLYNPKLGRYATCDCAGQKRGSKPSGLPIRSFAKKDDARHLQRFAIARRRVGDVTTYTFHVADEYAIGMEGGNTGNSTKLKVAQLGGDRDGDCHFQVTMFTKH